MVSLVILYGSAVLKAESYVGRSVFLFSSLEKTEQVIPRATFEHACFGIDNKLAQCIISQT